VGRRNHPQVPPRPGRPLWAAAALLGPWYARQKDLDPHPTSSAASPRPSPTGWSTTSAPGLPMTSPSSTPNRC